MSQAPTNGTNLLDPFGVWKAARDANLEAWSKLMIDIVNSDEYAQATGVALEQVLATSQPIRDAMERTMTQTLSMLNMPSRAEVTSLAERLVNVEMRLDDMDAKLNSVQKSLERTIEKTVHDATSTQNSHLKDLAKQLDTLDAKQEPIRKIEASLAELSTQLKAMQVPAAQATQPVSAPKPGPNAKAEKAGPGRQPQHPEGTRREPADKNKQEAK
jgi:hypothetical protein